MKKPLILLVLALLLGGGIGHSQEAPASTDNPTAQTKQASKFQGLWQQRKGHGLYLDFGYGFVRGDFQWPFRFDLTYQYDIPWQAKRVNLFVESGIGYERFAYHFNDDIAYKFQRIQQRALWRLGGGFKIHCTNWLYLSFAGGFQVGYDNEQIEEIDQSNGTVVYRSISELTLLGGQSAIQIVGQIKRVSIHLGYRANHWTHVRRNEIDKMMVPLNFTEWFLTAGVGYHF